MKIINREFKNNVDDFLKIRNLLVESYSIKKSLFNWGAARWDTVRYRVRVKDYISNNKNFIKKNHLWETDKGKLIGAVLSENNDNDIVIVIHPDFEELENKMFYWAESNAKHENFVCDKEQIIKTCVYDHNKQRQKLLIERGYKKQSEAEYTRVFDLSKDIASVELPKGFLIRNVQIPKEYENRVEIHQKAFGSKKFNLEVFKILQKAPGYRIKNDLIIVGPEGHFVCFCIFWIDEVNEFAEIEPFGTHFEYRNMGLGKALLTEVLKRLKKRQIKCVYVGSDPEPAVGNRRYESVGFSDKKIAFWWTKNLKK